MSIAPRVQHIAGQKFVSVDDLVEQIDAATPLIALHGILNADESFSVGMIQGYEAIKVLVQNA